MTWRHIILTLGLHSEEEMAELGFRAYWFGVERFSVVVSELSVIYLHELARLNIYGRFGDTWAWVDPRPERQQAAMAGAPEGAPAANEGARAILVPMQTVETASRILVTPFEMQSDGVRIIEMALERNRLKEALEDSVKRRRQDVKVASSRPIFYIYKLSFRVLRVELGSHY
nr:hypothetical protein [Tanacetum cinerariifolium]